MPASARSRIDAGSLDERAVVVTVLIIKAVLLVYGAFVFQVSDSQALTTAASYLEIWNRWDGPHYLDLARHGYQATGEDRLLLVFYPLYPLAIRLFAFVLRDYLVSALVVSTIASIVAAVELYRLAAMDFSSHLARLAAWFLFIFPTSFFLSINYTESLFLCLVLGAFLAARRSHWMAAGVLGLLAGLTHPNGVLLLPALMAEAFSSFRHERRFDLRWLWTASIILAPLIYMLINYLVARDPLAFIHMESQHWVHVLVPPWRGIGENLNVALTYEPYEAQMIGVQVLLFLGIALVATIFSAWVLPLSYTVWMASNWLLFASQSWDISAPRYVLCMFPMFLLMARLARNRYWSVLITMWSLLWLAAFAGEFVVGHWVF